MEEFQLEKYSDFISSGTNVHFNVAFCLLEAKTMFEYCAAIYVCISVLAIIMTYLLKIFEIESLLNFNQKIDEFVEKCELNRIF